MFGEKLAHANQAKVCKIRFAAGVALRQFFKLSQMLVTIERQCNQTFVQHLKYVPGLGMKRGFGEDGFAGQTRFRQLGSQTDRPIVILVAAIDEGDEKSSVSNCDHALVE